MGRNNEQRLTGNFGYQRFLVQLTPDGQFPIGEIDGEVFQGMQTNERFSFKTRERHAVSRMPRSMYGEVNGGEATVEYTRDEMGVPILTGDIGYPGGTALNGKSFRLEEQDLETNDGKPHLMEGYFHGKPLKILFQYGKDGSIQSVQGFLQDIPFQLST